MKIMFFWLGGKICLVKYLLLLINDWFYICYVEVFVGSVVMLFECVLVKIEVLNDMYGELVRFYCVVVNYLDEFVCYFWWLLISWEMYWWV